VSPLPQEPPTGEPDDDGLDHLPDDVDTYPRGWIDPDDRLWRHPSELAGSASAVRVSSADGGHRSRIMIAVGAVTALAAVAWIVILLSPASQIPSTSLSGDATSDAPMTTLAGAVYAIPAIAGAASRSVVQLRAQTSHGQVAMVGVAVAEGGLVVTTADDLKGLRSIDMIGPGGHLMRASILGVDSDSDLALVNVPDDIPVAPFSDDASVTDGSPDMTLSTVTPHAAVASLRCSPGTVTGVGTAILQGPADGMPAITSTAADVKEEAGDPLLNPSGAVIGIFYGDESRLPTFLPTQLVLGVADDLRSTGRVAHGWLGVDGPDTSSMDGAPVASIVSGSPVAGLLHSGEVITAIGTDPVRSMAELRARLYVLAPETTVTLSVLDGSVTRLVDVTLSPSP
jgi:S1-C subfamily serine protease